MEDWLLERKWGTPSGWGKHGQTPGVRQGENNGSGGESLGPQNIQHGSGADVRNAPIREATVGWPAMRPEAGAVNWGIFSQARAEAVNQEEEVSGERIGKRSKGVDGGRSRSPLVGKFRTKTQKRKGEQSPMVQPKGKVKEAPTTTVEPPPGMVNGGNVNGGGNAEKVHGGMNFGANVGMNFGSVNGGKGPGENGVGQGGGAVTREEIYGVVWGLTQG